MAVELVAGEAEDGEVFRVLGLELLVEGLEVFELGGEAALGGGVDDEDDLAVEGAEGEGLALLCSRVLVAISLGACSFGKIRGLQEKRKGV